MRGQFSTLSRETAERLWFWTHLLRERGPDRTELARLEADLEARLWPERNDESKAA